MISLSLFLLGLIIGSFLNVLIYRIPLGESFVAGRSHCPHCKHDLAWYDLFPVLSFLFLRGRCRYCRHAISWQYPIIELFSGVFFVFAPSVGALIALELLLVLAIIDLEHLILPDGLLAVVLVSAIALRVINHNPWLSAILTGLGCGLFFLIPWLVSRGRWIGFGDVKFAAILGFFFGFPTGLLVIYAAIILGGAVGALLLLFRRATMKTALPFGTLLAFSACGFILFHAKILAWVSPWWS